MLAFYLAGLHNKKVLKKAGLVATAETVVILRPRLWELSAEHGLKICDQHSHKEGKEMTGCDSSLL
jgi:hypothetical protein